MTQYRIIDVDTHVTESADLWTSRVPAKMRDTVPQVRVDKKGRSTWYIEGKPIAKLGLSATAGVGSMINPPNNYSDMHPGAYDANERLRYMDQMGIWAMVMYPNVGGFGNQAFLKL